MTKEKIYRCVCLDDLVPYDLRRGAANRMVYYMNTDDFLWQMGHVDSTKAFFAVYHAKEFARDSS